MTNIEKGKRAFSDAIKGFKGLEADAVVLVYVTKTDEGFTLQDAHMAYSRAKHELLIVPANIEAKNLFFIWLGEVNTIDLMTIARYSGQSVSVVGRRGLDVTIQYA